MDKSRRHPQKIRENADEQNLPSRITESQKAHASNSDPGRGENRSQCSDDNQCWADYARHIMFQCINDTKLCPNLRIILILQISTNANVSHSQLFADWNSFVDWRSADWDFIVLRYIRTEALQDSPGDIRPRFCMRFPNPRICCRLSR